MKQTISNACGTVAMIHAVANNSDVIKLDDGFLKNFLESTKDDTPDERAKKLEGDQVSFVPWARLGPVSWVGIATTLSTGWGTLLF